MSGSPRIDSISFSYSTQTDFNAAGANNTNFDCEAFIVSADSIYLFTKEWISLKTSLYVLPKTSGEHIAEFRASLNTEGLITGASWLEQKRLIAICGYSTLLQPFIYLLYDFSGDDFFGGNKRKISLNLPFHQIEGIATEDGLSYYVSNERFSNQLITVEQKLHKLDLSAFLHGYISDDTTSSTTPATYHYVLPLLYPNPSTGIFNLKLDKKESFSIEVHSINGELLYKSDIRGEGEVDISQLPDGVYFIKLLNAHNVMTTKIIKNGL